MLDWTDRHFRYLCRLISTETLLYTEMVVCKSLIFNPDKERFLGFHDSEHPIALQLGGSDPAEFIECAKMAEQRGYDEININVGCPSDRVQSGFFGACLMANPHLIAECVDAMQQVVSIPITVKCRIGIDEQDSYQFLTDFINPIEAAGCNTFIIHARKAWLSGLSPKQNRDIPPIDYERVYQLKRDYPQLAIHINGSINTLDDAQCKLHHVDGVMMGRAVYSDPWVLHGVDSLLYGKKEKLNSPIEVVELFLPYIAAELENGMKLHRISRHMLGLFHGMHGAKKWRRVLSEKANRTENVKEGLSVLNEALNCVREN